MMTHALTRAAISHPCSTSFMSILHCIHSLITNEMASVCFPKKNKTLIKIFEILYGIAAL